jgi:hypothetical protein
MPVSASRLALTVISPVDEFNRKAGVPLMKGIANTTTSNYIKKE